MVLSALLIVSSLLSSVFANTPIPKPTCDFAKEVSVRFASSSNRIYVESLDGSRGGCMTLRGIYDRLSPEKSPVYPLDTPGEWYLESELFSLDGITLQIFGSEAGGDVDWLKVKSGSNGFVYIRGHGGSLDILSTKITSWDVSKNDVDRNLEDGRSFMSAISEVIVNPNETCSGFGKTQMGESRMDIENSIVAFMGYNKAESWGITWKLRGLCNDLSNLDDYHNIGVYGNLINNELYELYYGQYSFRLINGVISGNTIHDTELYTIDPHHASVNITISFNEVYNAKSHGIIISKYCHNSKIFSNYVHDSAGVGVFPHFISNNVEIYDNIIENNGDSGIAFLESSGGLVYGNTVKGNVHGIRFSVGSRDNTIIDNTFTDNSGYDVYTYSGNDAVVEQPDNTLVNNIIFRNSFSGNKQGFRLDDAVKMQFVGNTVTDALTFEVNDSPSVLLSGNTFPAAMQFDISSSCVETGGKICGSEPMVSFTSADGSKALGTPAPTTSATPESVASFHSPTGSPTGSPTSSPTGSSFSPTPTESSSKSTPRGLIPSPSPSAYSSASKISTTATASPTESGPETSGSPQLNPTFILGMFLYFRCACFVEKLCFL